MKDRDASSESTEFWRDRRFDGTERKLATRSFPLDVTGLETLCGLVGRLSLASTLLSKDVAIRNSGLVLPCPLPGFCEVLVQLCDSGSTVVDGLTVSSCGEVGWCIDRCGSDGGSAGGWLELTAVVSMVIVGLDGQEAGSADFFNMALSTERRFLGTERAVGKERRTPGSSLGAVVRHLLNDWVPSCRRETQPGARSARVGHGRRVLSRGR